ncbi:MAG: TetR/AcrR family transcriptional regulator [Anaerolineales bacterium]|nr:TetR/AcrR family transcriptional regulator [Anaerolineales bacterium]
MPKGIPLTQAEMEQRQREIAEKAVALFIEKGFNETSMRQIAKEAGAGKSTLYDYFASKDDIIVFFVQEHLEVLMQRAEAIIAGEGTASDHLRRVMEMHLAFLLENRAFYLRLMFEAQRLKIESQQRIQAQRYSYQDLVKSLIVAGIQQGCFRPVDATMAMKTLISMMTPVVYTSRPSGTPEEMLENGLDLILNGLQP